MAWIDSTDPLARTWPSAGGSTPPGARLAKPHSARPPMLLRSMPPEMKRRCERMYQQLSYFPPMRRAWDRTALVFGAVAVGALLLGLLL